ncbi:hypothetical protein GGS23DRAFT_405536 [Durotheca rogersii]|uniref:uncharacterized protein n=1 Tax=Durotheca rogersii TaxID=419775 RepID=UPI00221E4C17|nr:uncharacterized protein GGS23DRAFT_405536 [Durotheca rogersii]KAI5865035.1 hypothetical protein GGS23DRAFT_405536 [Durotheca rogersii]
MAHINFFVNWELWQQMTFVLAAAIVVVFLAGLVKLWWLSRYLKKHTVLDEEKRIRHMEMRKSGLPVGKRADIPFGVRAIQSGIEVDGIWISRPSTPVGLGQSSPSFASSSTLESDGRLKGKERENDMVISGGVRHSTMTVTEVEPTPAQSPQPSPQITPTSLSERRIPSDANQTQARASLPPGRPTYQPKGSSRRRTIDTSGGASFDAETLNRLEANFVRPRQVETYIPTNSSSSSQSSTSSRPRTTVGRNSTSSEEDVGHSNMRYTPTSRRSGIPMVRTHPLHDDVGSPPSNAGSLSDTPAKQTRHPSETQTPGSSPPISRPPLAANRPIPHRTYSGDAYANTTIRRVNAGFELLPAGTFDQPQSQNGAENVQPRSHSNSRAHKGRDRSSR